MLKLVRMLIVTIFICKNLSAGSFGYLRKNISDDPINNRIYIGINETGTKLFSDESKVKWNIVNYMVPGFKY